MSAKQMTHSDSAPQTECRPKILLYGDSNIWGYDPADGLQRPDRAASLLGRMRPFWRLQVDGQNGRSFSSRDPFCDTDASRQIGPALKKAGALDGIIIALGANDARRMNSQSPQAWQASLNVLVQALRQALEKYQAEAMPWVLLAAPPLMPDEALKRMDARIFFGNSGQKILAAAQSMTEQTAVRHGWYALRADAIGLYGGLRDGIHLDEAGHAIFARAIAQAVDGLIHTTSRPDGEPQKEGCI